MRHRRSKLFPRVLLRYRIRKGIMQPLFLEADNAEHRSIAERALAFYEANLGKEMNQIDFQELYYEVGDDRLAGALTYAMGHIYAYKPKIIGAEARASPLDLRLRLFRLVGSEPPGFALDRDKVLAAFKEIHHGKLGNLTEEQLEEYLWSDDPRSHILVREKEKAEPADVIHYYNLEVLDTILSNSTLIVFSTPGSDRMPRGTFAKSLVRHVKELGLIYEGRLEEGSVSINVYGPISLFGRPTRFAWRLSELFSRALPILREASTWMVDVMVHMKRKDLPCRITHETLPEFEAGIRRVEGLKPMFDSRVEEKFYRVMSSVDKYRVTREVDPIIFRDTLVVPDYVFERRDGVKWYLEIIGFWRPEYTAKKRAKLLELRKAGLERLILLVDRQYEQYFRDMGYPTFTYRMRGDKLAAPYGKIINTILS